MRRLRRLSNAVIIVGALGTAGCGSDQAPRPTERPPRSIAEVLSDTAAEGGFRHARPPAALRFPADHGAHPEFRNEWWYLTGNLATAEGRRFGYQFTLFRTALSANRPPGDSAWSTNQVYLAHAAVTDVTGGRLHSAERVARGALGLAGADSAPVRLWLGDWSIRERLEPTPVCPDCLAAAVHVVAEDFTISVRLAAVKPPALHGERGLSAKGLSNRNASYYYSYTRIATQGSLTVGGTRVAVTGTSWFDHEWSTSALLPSQSGWDWFSVQLSDTTEMMLFRLRDRELASRDFLSGSIIDAAGNVTPISTAMIEAVSSWRSPATGVTYPSGWRVVLPQSDVRLTLTPLLKNQEIDLMFRYWEGAVAVAGSVSGRRLDGYGYAELTGYE